MVYAESRFHLQSLTRPYTLMDAAFLRDYLDYYNEHQDGVTKNMKMLFKYLEEHKGITLIEEQQMDVKCLNTPEMKDALAEAYEAMRQDVDYEAALIDRWCGGIELVPMPADLKELLG